MFALWLTEASLWVSIIWSLSWIFFHVKRVDACSVSKSCLTLRDPIDCSPPGSSVHGIFQARILEQVVTAFSRGSSPPRDWIHIHYISGRFFTTELHEKRVCVGYWLLRPMCYSLTLLARSPSVLSLCREECHFLGNRDENKMLPDLKKPQGSVRYRWKLQSMPEIISFNSGKTCNLKFTSLTISISNPKRWCC